MKSRFFGGIHPPECKSPTEGCIPIPMPEPAMAIIPMEQHIGSPCVPLVRVGDRVCTGQKIGDGSGLCVPVHASVSGTVKAVEPRPAVSGQAVLSVVIENDFQDTKSPECVPHPDFDTLPPQRIIELLREGGLVGMGGAAFPTYQKISSAMGRVDTLIANACECEPYMTADDLLLRTAPRDVLRGMELLRRAAGARCCILAVEDNKRASIAGLRPLLAEHPSVRLAVLPTRYPQGAEKQLIQAVTGRQVPPGALPADVGCVVCNAGTCAAAARAVQFGEPLTQRIVTVAGDGVRTPGNYLVRVGTPFSEVLEEAGGVTDTLWRVLSGGPMMGVAQSSLEVPVVKNTTGILCLTEAQNREVDHPVCIRCGKCVRVCPMKLQPLYLYRCGQADAFDALDRLHLADCIGCGCCAYVCPGRLPLVAQFRASKQRRKEADK